jgi:isocitrate dehydrogenase
MYWAQKLATQTEDVELARIFTPLAEQLTNEESQIVSDLDAVQGSTVDLQGYFFPAEDVVTNIMCPSETFNQILAEFAG